jgi:hypothetical protein
MTKRTRALSGASQDAYFRRLLRSHSSLTPDERDKIVQLLRREIAQLRLRRQQREGDAEASREAHSTPTRPAQVVEQPTPARPADVQPAPIAPRTEPVAAPFDPFSINVVVLLRTGGRERLLGALECIDSADNLRLLAREQRLSVGAETTTPAELRAAIVQAAERRVANRIAAAS